jgi:hypothetical protein
MHWLHSQGTLEDLSEERPSTRSSVKTGLPTPEYGCLGLRNTKKNAILPFGSIFLVDKAKEIWSILSVEIATSAENLTRAAYGATPLHQAAQKGNSEAR